MAENSRDCRRCLLYEMADKAQYESVRAYLDSIPEEEKTEKDIYEARLAKCRDCDSLISGMCRKCGCYVEIRAALTASRCPDYPAHW